MVLESRGVQLTLPPPPSLRVLGSRGVQLMSPLPPSPPGLERKCRQGGGGGSPPGRCTEPGGWVRDP